ncbi:hypothetical protein SAMN05443287_101300 [Micromonospora phaseoli]|uniref:Uncharacterized protein n=1 Tax=Micromonospora phaseoli TaxID=1144548 RepID=A0A1H6RSU0_9ACTN|nr:hypothetical protein [Micromonospora phaseoli]PZW03555.1 hypothetical protein CLV64_101300 [Micromonospora phaseoli]GIJ77121.1 hypothetical protein Xph01_15530 [Micromonospora phaseoli]SEI56524.1 hypothetical protein SAMN05443287_101300 [Micromonospora phaseoli]
MSHRILPVVVLLTVTGALAACGGGPDRPAGPNPPASAASADAVPSEGPANPTGPDVDATEPTTAAGPVGPATAVAPAGPATAAGPAGPTADGGTERRPPSPPPVVLPPRQEGAPTAGEVVAAFRAAGLKVANPRDRSIECGPDGLGLGCSELVVTDNVAVYVFPDESSAGDLAERWSGAAYRSGTVVLNYRSARTPPTDRSRYQKTLDTLR